MQIVVLRSIFLVFIITVFLLYIMIDSLAVWEGQALFTVFELKVTAQMQHFIGSTLLLFAAQLARILIAKAKALIFFLQGPSQLDNISMSLPSSPSSFSGE